MGKNILYSFLGTERDAGFNEKRLSRWRPNPGVSQCEDLRIDTLVLMHERRHLNLAEMVAQDARGLAVNEGFTVELLEFDLSTDNGQGHYDLARCFDAMVEIGNAANFDPENVHYLNLSTGTHIMQIAAYLMCESKIWPAIPAQLSPQIDRHSTPSKITTLDLSLATYDRVMHRSQAEVLHEEDVLKNGIKTLDPAFNKMVSKLLKIASRSRSPIVLMGQTGVGKTAMARRLHNVKTDVKRALGGLKGPIVEVNCATLRGDTVLSTLFGHKKGAFTGAAQDRDGMLKKANGGMLFLDEIGELSAEVQAMLLHALEEKKFFPMGADTPVQSDFELIVGTNRNLQACVEEGTFRADLLARINTWTFTIPGLGDRRQDIGPNIDFELAKLSQQDQVMYRFVADAKAAYLSFAIHPDATWAGNFRDLASSVERMVTLSDNGMITRNLVDEEIMTLKKQWGLTHNISQNTPGAHDLVERVLPGSTLNDFDKAQLEAVLRRCGQARSNADLGRLVYGQDVGKNPSQRARDFLASHGLTLQEVKIRLEAS